jgi:beta-aspartyl-peptidase (threonine type)
MPLTTHTTIFLCIPKGEADMQPRLIIHGGAWDWGDKYDQPKAEALHQALKIGYDMLKNGASALDAVEKTINYLEDEPLFDAGIGSHLNENGTVELDAILIDGTTRDFGAVAGVQRVRYPITLAHHVMRDTPHRLFVGAGADDLALKLGMPQIANLSLVTQTEWQAFVAQDRSGTRDTVGAVAIDAEGNIAVGTSTGGTPLKMAGRVGDSPLFGAGGYGDSRYGGASASGKGENSMRLLLTRTTVDYIAQGMNAQTAADKAIQDARDFVDDSMVAVIVLDKDGNVGAAHSTPKLSCGWIGDDGQPYVSMRGGVQGETL